jgi:predicted SprT family Zn-dependent metalloprotease
MNPKALHTFQTAAKILIAEHLGRKWKFRWHNGLSSLGLCDYDNKVISISKPMAREIPRREVLETLAHELAHSLTPDDPGHGEEWREMAKRLGARTKNDGWTEKLEKVSKRLQKRRNAKKRSKS